MRKENVDITVYRGEQDDEGFPSYLTVTEFLAWVTKYVEAIPAEFRDNSWLIITSEGGDYGSFHAAIVVGYTRSETEEEKNARVAREAQARAALAAAREAQERAQYEQLRAKFESAQLQFHRQSE